MERSDIKLAKISWDQPGDYSPHRILRSPLLLFTFGSKQRLQVLYLENQPDNSAAIRRELTIFGAGISAGISARTKLILFLFSVFYGYGTGRGGAGPLLYGTGIYQRAKTSFTYLPYFPK